MLKEYDVLGKLGNDKFSQELDALDYDLFPQFVRMRLNEKEVVSTRDSFDKVVYPTHEVIVGEPSVTRCRKIDAYFPQCNEYFPAIRSNLLNSSRYVFTRSR
jgi:hypothetical protein